MTVLALAAFLIVARAQADSLTWVRGACYRAREMVCPLRADYYVFDGTGIWATGYDDSATYLALAHLDESGWSVVPLPPIAGRGGPPAVDATSVYVPILGRTFVVVDKKTRSVRTFEVPAHEVLPLHPPGLASQALGGMSLGPDGGVWYISQNTRWVGRFNPRNQRIEEFKLPLVRTKFAFAPLFVGTTMYWLEKQTGELASYDIVSRTFRERMVFRDSRFPLGALDARGLEASAFLNGLLYDAGRATLWMNAYNRGTIIGFELRDAHLRHLKVPPQGLAGIGLMGDCLVVTGGHSNPHTWYVVSPESGAVWPVHLNSPHRPDAKILGLHNQAPANRLFAAEVEGPLFSRYIAVLEKVQP